MPDRDHLNYVLTILKTFYGSIDNETKILDLGCGSGWLVNALNQQGYDAYGCDLKFKDGKHVEQLSKSGKIKLIDENNYEIPFDNNNFDVVISFQVLEHVQDYNFFAKETRRVLSRNGKSIHVFPAAWRPLESHILVPFGAVIQNIIWFYLFTFLGFCKKKQRGQPWIKVAKDNLEYMKEHTNYISRRKILFFFKQYFTNVTFSEADYFMCSQHAATKRLAKLPLKKIVGFLYSVFWRRVLVIS